MPGRRCELFGCVLVFLATTLLAVGADGQNPRGELARRRQQWRQWLSSEYQRVRSDSERLVELAGKLRTQGGKQDRTALEEGWLERVEMLKQRSEEVRDTVAKIDENFLSVSVVQEAREIQAEARALREAWQRSPRSKQLKRMRDLAREMEKKADAIADRMRLP